MFCGRVALSLIGMSLESKRVNSLCDLLCFPCHMVWQLMKLDCNLSIVLLFLSYALLFLIQLLVEFTDLYVVHRSLQKIPAYQTSIAQKSVVMYVPVLGSTPSSI
jgi:hypothetical protein